MVKTGKKFRGDFIPKNFENLTDEEKKQMYETWIKSQQEQKKEVKHPIMTEWIPLGKNYGVSISIWDNGITLQKRKRNESGEWENTNQKFNLSKTIMERIFLKIPGWYAMVKEKNEES